MGKGSQTLGYHYIMTLFMHLGRGPIDELVQIDVGGEMAWKGSLSDDTPTAINAPDLFGGEKREGGIQGAFRLLQGDAAQVLPGASSTVTVGSTGPVRSAVVPDIKAAIGQAMGEMRGICSIVYDGLVSSMSPYPKEWKFRLRRSAAGWHGGAAWYPAKATICVTGDGNYQAEAASEDPETARTTYFSGVQGELIGSTYNSAIAAAAALGMPDKQIKGMNPAHIIYQAMTDPLWGAGRDPSEIDENSFIYAANTLCNERFPLCLLWAREEDVDAFIQVVADHIAAAVYIDPPSGKWAIRLIRDDYDPDDLPVYTFASGLLRVEDDDNASNVDSFNEVRVTGVDPVTGNKFEVWAQSLAALQDPEAEIISRPIELKGVPTRALALRVAERELRPFAAGLKRYRLRFDRRGRTITPGMPLRIQAPERGLDDIVLRVVDVDYGSPQEPQIVVRAMEDVFAFPDSAFGTVVSGVSTAVPSFPFRAPRTLLVEAGYRDLYRTVGQSEAQSAADTSAFIGQFALAPNAAAIDFRLASKVTGEPAYQYVDEQPFTTWARLAAPVGLLDTTIVFDLNDAIDASLIGEALLVGGPDGELVRLEAITGNTATVARGCADTVPQEHAAGSEVWAADDTIGHDGREYAVAEQVTTLVLTRTSNGLLAESDAVAENLTLAGRHALPFPPAKVTVDGDEALDPVDIHPEPVIAWVSRNRLLQADALVSYGETGVAAEAGATFRIRIFDENDLVTPLRTEAAIASPWTYTTAMQTADGDPVRVICLLDSQRDGLDSWQAQRFAINLKGGYGYAYGMDYGGA